MGAHGIWQILLSFVSHRPAADVGDTINAALRVLGFAQEEMCAHGFRAMAATLLNESGRFHPDAIERQLARLGSAGWFQATDVQDASQIEAFIAGAVERFGPIDTLIINAGIEPPHVLPLAELSIEDVDAVLSTNLRGTLLTAKYAIPHLRRPGGSIMTVSSLWGRQGGALLPVYSATKGGSQSLTRALAVELGGEGIRVNGIAPGFIKTEMSDRFTQGRDMRPFYEANVPLGRIGEAQEIADAMVWLASDQASYVTGQTITVDGGHNIKMSVAGL